MAGSDQSQSINLAFWLTQSWKFEVTAVSLTERPALAIYTSLSLQVDS